MLGGVPGINELRNFSHSWRQEPTEILRLEEFQDDQGYQRPRWNVVENTHSFRMPMGQREMMRANQAGYQAELKCLLPIESSVTLEDRIRVAGHEYEVVGITEMTDSMQAHRSVFISRSQ